MSVPSRSRSLVSSQAGYAFSALPVAFTSTSARPQQFGRMADHGLPPALPHRERWADFRDRLLRRRGVDDDKISRVAGCESVILQIEELRRALGEAPQSEGLRTHT